MIYITITPFFPEPDNFRGPYVYDQVKAIIKSNKYDKVIVFKPSLLQNNEKDYVYDGIEVYRFNTLQVPSAILPGAFNWYNIASFKLIFKPEQMFNFPAGTQKQRHFLQKCRRSAI